MGSVASNIQPTSMQFLSLVFLLLPLSSWAMSVGNEDAVSFFRVPEPRADYSFGEEAVHGWGNGIQDTVFQRGNGTDTLFPRRVVALGWARGNQKRLTG